MHLERSDFLDIQERVRAVMRSVPAHHGFGRDGFGHIQVGAECARIVALAERADPNFNAIVYLIHDIRWWDGTERRARSIKVDVSGQPGQESGKDIILPLCAGRKINARQMKDAIEAADKHSKLPSDDLDATPLRRQIRDADRLSRMGVAGLLSILEGNNYYGNVPFYRDGDEIVRAEDASMIPFKDINTNVTDINSCLDWERILETGSGRILFPVLCRVNREFLQTFAQHQDLRDYNMWVGWLEGIKQRMSMRRLDLRARLEEGQITVGEYIRTLVELEDPRLVSEESFREYTAASSHI